MGTMGTTSGRRRRRPPRLTVTVVREGALWVAYDHMDAWGTGRTLRGALVAYARGVHAALRRYADADAERRLDERERRQWETYRAVFEAGRAADPGGRSSRRPERLADEGDRRGRQTRATDEGDNGE